MKSVGEKIESSPDGAKVESIDGKYAKLTNGFRWMLEDTDVSVERSWER
ncbi:hypothetical protein M5X04_12185 [Paenibacillus alvei]|uniref:Uncharacterized protein n=1 Tax=Paenibacillus alvei TaxID=44250 RepID=A0ABT4E8L3_PAEAL|nr:hypothetical protein [Paenibacillus alvei]MCY9530084.1 hypothetical protein [Paenibacillus alvei]